MKSRVMLVEDQTIFREMLAALLDVHGHEVVAQLDRSAEARVEIERKRPDLVVVDVVLPDGNGLDLARWIRDTWPKTRVMVVTAQEKASIVAEALRIRVHGIVMKNASLRELEQAVDRVTEGGVFYCASSSQWIRESAMARPSEALSLREREIVQMVARGSSTKEIASALGLSPKTVSNHRFRIARKLGIDDVAGLTRYAIGQGWISEDE